MLKLKAVSSATLLALAGFSNFSFAQNLPASYKVIDLGALEKAEVNGDAGITKSFGFALNNSGMAVGASEGAYTFTRITRDDNNNPTGTEDSELNLFHGVVYDPSQQTITSLVPQNQTFGFGFGTNIGMYAMDITNSGLAVGYGATRDTETEFNVDCNTIDQEDCREYVRAFYHDGNQINYINASVRYGLTLDSNILEYTNTRAFGANSSWVVGYLNQVTSKTNTGTDEDPNYTVNAVVNRAFMYDLLNQELLVLSPLDADDNTSESKIFAVNEAGTFVGMSQVLNEESNQELRAIYGTVGTDSFSQVSGLEGATFSYFSNLNETGTYAVGYSNSGDALGSREAFYYDFSSGLSAGIGYLNESINNSQAFAVNDDNLVVGISMMSTRPDVYNPFIYDIDDPSAEPINLNSMIQCDSGWTLTEARDINNDGYIVGTGTVTATNSDGSRTGEIRAFMLEPSNDPIDESKCETAEPPSGGSSWLVTLLALLGLRRKR